MADNVPSPQQPATGSQNQVPATAQNQEQKPAPTLAEQATQQTQQAAQQAQNVVGQAGQVVGNVQQTGQQVAQGAQQAMGQAGQVAGQATAIFGAAASLITSQPTQPQPPVTQEEKVWGALSYIPMVALVALLIKPKSDFVKLHAKQGLLIFVIFFFSIFLYIILPPLGPLVGGLIQLAMFVIGVFSIYQALMGNWWKTPVLGQISDMIPVSAFTNVATQAITGQEPVQNPPVDVMQPTVDQQQPGADQTPPVQNPPPTAPNPPVQQ